MQVDESLMNLLPYSLLSFLLQELLKLLADIQCNFPVSSDEGIPPHHLLPRPGFGCAEVRELSEKMEMVKRRPESGK